MFKLKNTYLLAYKQMIAVIWKDDWYVSSDLKNYFKTEKNSSNDEKSGKATHDTLIQTTLDNYKRYLRRIWGS